MNQVFADLSNNNAGFDAAAYRAGGHVFVALKVTEGVGFVDFKHRGFALGAGLHHIGVAHYHFADLFDPVAEATHFLRHALPLAGPLDYLVLDMERGNPNRDPAWCQKFDAHVRSQSRFKTIIYASQSFLEVAPADAWFSAQPYRFWDANWSQQPDFAPRGGTCVMRQSSDGVFGPEPHGLPGVGQCDVNHLRGGFAAKVLSKA